MRAFFIYADALPFADGRMGLFCQDPVFRRG